MSPNPAAVILRLQIALVAFVLMSGVALTALFGVSIVGIQQIAFQVLWTGHVFFHCLAIGIALTLLIHLSQELTTPAMWLYLGLITVGSGIHLLSATMPWTAFHSVSMEMPLARWWLTAGRMTEMPWYPAASLPAGIVPVYAGFLNGPTSFLLGTYHASYSILLAGLLATFVFYKTHDEELSLWAAVILMFCPFMIYTAGQPSDILPAACFFGLAYGSGIVWGEQHGRWYYLAVPGFALGFASFLSAEGAVFGTVLLISLFGFFLTWKFPVTKALLAIGLILISAAAASSLLLFRNFIWSGNPFYPLIGSHVVLFHSIPFPREWFAGLAFAVFGLIPLVRKSRNMHRVSPWARATWFLFVGGVALSWTFYSRDGEEMVIPFLLPLIVLSAVGIEQIVERKQVQQSSFYLRGSIVLHLMLVTGAAFWTGGILQSGLFLTGKIASADILTDDLAGYSAAKAISKLLPPTAGIFLAGHTDLPLYYLRRTPIGVSRSGEILSGLLRESGNPQEFARRLFLGGVTHLVLGNTVDLDLEMLSPDEKNIWREFLKNFTERAGEADGRFIRKLQVSQSS